MTLQSQRDLESTREKLRLLECLYAEAQADVQGDAEVRETELESLQRQINQMKEQIARFETRHTARH